MCYNRFSTKIFDCIYNHVGQPPPPRLQKGQGSSWKHGGVGFRVEDNWLLGYQPSLKHCQTLSCAALRLSPHFPLCLHLLTRETTGDLIKMGLLSLYLLNITSDVLGLGFVNMCSYIQYKYNIIVMKYSVAQ